MNDYKVVYWYGGNKLVTEIEGNGLLSATYNFYMNTDCDDIVSVTLVGDE